VKKKYILHFFLILLILTAAISCKSTQQTTDTPPQTEALDPDKGPPGQSDLDALNAAAERAAKARQLVIDFEGPDYYPSEWADADSLYSQAESGKDTSTLGAARASTARYNAAADALAVLADKTIPKYAEDLTNQVVEARDKAVNAGASSYAEYFLIQADDTAYDAQDQYEAKDYYTARDTAQMALKMYQTLETGTAALLARQEIEDRGFVRYDPSAIESTDEAAYSAIDDYEAKNIDQAQVKVADLLVRYQASLAKAKEAYASDAGAAAASERQRALDLKANVAIRQDYDAANVLYNRAVSSFRGKNFDDAADLYDQSRVLFEAVSRSARDKRRAAEEALRSAEIRMAESDETAQRAELILEGADQ
jgi:hypothetical protein